MYGIDNRVFSNVLIKWGLKVNYYMASKLYGISYETKKENIDFYLVSH